ncbi:OLC1v1000157C1 [Oldenlandia corymbosa var. corymbosa]|uniref:OLC1v1000157C1 n=1 Tax=Oldenlandia corymbosa var. corymbosa TaxID=529605 RepID=A0AAV1D2J7_OLDCO|nr:OLC1v1000157C1 [Oldenlandia corymbosa var. corymbosa]
MIPLKLFSLVVLGLFLFAQPQQAVQSPMAPPPPSPATCRHILFIKTGNNTYSGTVEDFSLDFGGFTVPDLLSKCDSLTGGPCFGTNQTAMVQFDRPCTERICNMTIKPNGELNDEWNIESVDLRTYPQGTSKYVYLDYWLLSNKFIYRASVFGGLQSSSPS